MSDYYLVCKGSKTGKHDWTPFEFSRWTEGVPGATHPKWAIKVRHCKNCDIYNEEVDETTLPEGFVLHKSGIVTSVGKD